MTPVRVEAAEQMRAAGKTYDRIAAALGVSRSSSLGMRASLPNRPEAGVVRRQVSAPVASHWAPRVPPTGSSESGYPPSHTTARLSCPGARGSAAIARALVTSPRLVLADEPTASLDAHGACEMLALLRDAVGGGVAVILVTHDNTVSARAGREVLLRDGVVEHEISLR